MLTCKSLFGLGYRGERLIEPFDARWLRVPPEKAGASRCSAGKIVKLRGHVATPSVGLLGRKAPAGTRANHPWVSSQPEG